MRKSGVVICSGLDDEAALRVVVLLASMGIDADADTQSPTGVVVRVGAADADRAKELVREEFPLGPEVASEHADGARITGTTSVPPREHDGWFGPGTAAVVAVALACVAVFAAAYTGADAGSRTRLLAYGAISWQHVEQGQAWRLVTAIFLHFGLPHLLANMVVLFIVGPPLARDIGGWRFLGVFLATGITGNAISHHWAPVVGLKAGASGAIAGVLGALAGQALHPARRSTRYRSWQVLGALAAIYGLLIGFGPGRDNAAHLGGLLAGVFLGRFIDPHGGHRPRFDPREPERLLHSS